MCSVRKLINFVRSRMTINKEIIPIQIILIGIKTTNIVENTIAIFTIQKRSLVRMKEY